MVDLVFYEAVVIVIRTWMFPKKTPKTGLYYEKLSSFVYVVKYLLSTHAIAATTAWAIEKLQSSPASKLQQYFLRYTWRDYSIKQYGVV